MRKRCKVKFLLLLGELAVIGRFKKSYKTFRNVKTSESGPPAKWSKNKIKVIFRIFGPLEVVFSVIKTHFPCSDLSENLILCESQLTEQLCVTRTKPFERSKSEILRPAVEWNFLVQKSYFKRFSTNRSTYVLLVIVFFLLLH